MNPGKQALGTNCPTPESNGMSQSEGQDSPRVCSKISINHYNPGRVITELFFLGKDEPRVLVPVAHTCCRQLALPASPGAGPQTTFRATFHRDSFPTASPHPDVHQFNCYGLSTYYMPGSHSHFGDRGRDKINKNPILMGLKVQWGKVDSRHTCQPTNNYKS